MCTARDALNLGKDAPSCPPNKPESPDRVHDRLRLRRKQQVRQSPSNWYAGCTAEAARALELRD
jgi:hypothetical protein